MAQPFSISGTFYKIADGPLDIRTQQIQVLVNGGTNPETILPENWGDMSITDPGTVNSGSLYSAGIYTGYMSSEYIFVCDNVVLNGVFFNIGGEMPFTGIFVSENIRSISIPESEEVHKIETKYLTSCIVIPFTKSDGGNITCDLSMEELNGILRSVNQPSDVCPALNGVLGIPGYSMYRDNGSTSLVFAFQRFGGEAGRLSIDDGGSDPKTITSLSAFNLGYTLLFVSQDGNVGEEDASYTVPLWTVLSD